MTALPLKSQIQEDMKTAMRAQEKERLGTIRLLLAAIKQVEVDERVNLEDIGIIAVIEKMIKQRRESVRQYEAGHRPDLAAKENQEIVLLQSYLPTPFTAAEITAAIEEAVKTVGATSLKDVGKVMNTLKPQLQGRADMGAVSAQVKQRLS